MSVSTIPAPQFYLHPLEPLKNVRMTPEIKVPHEIFHRILDFIPTQSLFLIQQINHNWLRVFAHYLIPRAATNLSKRMCAVLAFNANPRDARMAYHKKIMRSDPYLSVLTYHKQIDHLVPLLNADIFYDKDTRKIVISDIAFQYLKQNDFESAYSLVDRLVLPYKQSTMTKEYLTFEYLQNVCFENGELSVIQTLQNDKRAPKEIGLQLVNKMCLVACWIDKRLYKEAIDTFDQLLEHAHTHKEKTIKEIVVYVPPDRFPDTLCLDQLLTDFFVYVKQTDIPEQLALVATLETKYQEWNDKS